jgi:hypothetical protein
MLTSARTTLRTARVARTFTSSASARAQAGHGHEGHHESGEANTNECQSRRLTEPELTLSSLLHPYFPDPSRSRGSRSTGLPVPAITSFDVRFPLALTEGIDRRRPVAHTHARKIHTERGRVENS